MKSLVWLMIAMLAMAVVHSQRLDSKSQNFKKRIPATQKSQKKFIAEEVVVYLTPNQIKSIQEGKGFIDAGSIAEIETSQENKEGSDPDLLEGDGVQLQPNESDTQVSQEAEDQVASTVPVEKSSSKKIEDEHQFPWVYRTQKQRNLINIPEDLYRYLIDYAEIESQSEEAQVESEEAQDEPEEVPVESEEAQANPEEVQVESEEAQTGSVDAQAESEDNQEQAKDDSERDRPVIAKQQKYKLVPYESASERIKPNTTATPPTERLRERWLRLLEQNRIQLKKAFPEQNKTTTTTTISTTTTEQPSTKPQPTLPRSRYSAKYKSQNQSNENKNQRGKNLLKSQKGVIRDQAPANNGTNIVRKEQTKANKQKQNSIIKEVRVHTPVFIPIPEYLEEKLSRTSNASLKDAKPELAQKVKTYVNDKKVESAARVVGVKPKGPSLKKVSSATNNTYVIASTLTDSAEEGATETNSRQKGKPERITIIRHVFEN